MTNICRIGVAGAAGRMGQMLVRAIATTDGAKLTGGVEAPGSAALGRDLGEVAGIGAQGAKITAEPAPLFAACDAVLDFTVPAATMKHAALAAERGIVHVVGTTALEPEQVKQLEGFARRTPIVFAPNMSVGINLLMALTERVASILGGQDWDIEILEIHHNKKVDAPSGTALGLGAAAAKGRKVELSKVAQRVRDGLTGPRRAGDIGFATLRGGNVTGDHTVIFAGENERIELTHKSSSREIYARGAVRAALWAQGKPPGLYTMRDVLGL
ncbi:MAG: 4-hydroxy-tetrahydrodipicolinate reductase [Alphaproteobacteria bacterium]|nr:4-hydroxy-tetrahydrodipicolinate reductase [Alphaproteobacteria bacterium]